MAKHVAEALSQRGYDVFWDAKIPTGMTFDTYIYQELEDTDAVIVLWSKHSVESDYVKEEAEYAKKKSVLVPLTIDATDPPFGFARIQSTDISGWHGSTKDPRWQTVVDSIEAILGDVVLHNLPMELTSFVGREAEVGEVAGLLKDARLVTLTGVGGVGKTRIALQVAAGAIDHYPDGVWLVELGALSDPDLIPKQVAVAMGVQEQANRPIAATLLEVTSSKEVLLVLDNCEHLIEGVAVLADELLRSCAGVRLLATSREPLGVSGETVWTLQPMPVPSVDIDPEPDRLGATESIRLFIDRARLADREFSLSKDNAAACAEICRRLDGVPLAIELAAASVSALSPHQIAERLDDRLALLVKGTRTALPRQQTLRAAIDWSYELLTPEEQRFFRRLSVFRGGFTPEAVEALWSHEERRDRDALELLTHLVDKSLVVITSRAETRRFGLLETIRQYAWERLESAQETDATLAEHREWFTSWAKEQERLLATADQLAALEALETDYDNLRAILERSMASGDVEPALRIAADISFFWWLHSHFGEAGAWFKRLLAVGERAPPRVHAKLLLGAGQFSWSMSDHELAKERLSEARRIAQKIDAPRLEGWALAYLMMNEVFRLNFDAARVYGEQSLRIFQNADVALGIGFVTYMQTLGDYFGLRGNNEMTPEAAEDLMSKLEPMVAGAQQLGDRNLLGYLLELLGSIALEAGRIDEAGAHLSEAVRGVRHPWKPDRSRPHRSIMSPCSPRGSTNSQQLSASWGQPRPSDNTSAYPPGSPSRFFLR